MGKIDNLTSADNSIHAFEQDSRDSVPDSLRTLGEYAKDLGFASSEAFEKFIEGKKVLDIGSGYGGFAIHARLKKLNTTIVSVNPRRYYDPDFEIKRVKLLLACPPFNQVNRSDLDEAIRMSDANTYPYFAHNLKFEDQTFDIVIDNHAVFFYGSSQYLPIYRKSFQEMMRVKKSGGCILIGDQDFMYGKQHVWKMQLATDLKLSPIPLIPPGKPDPVGIQITR